MANSGESKEKQEFLESMAESILAYGLEIIHKYFPVVEKSGYNLICQSLNQSQCDYKTRLNFLLSDFHNAIQLLRHYQMLSINTLIGEIVCTFY